MLLAAHEHSHLMRVAYRKSHLVHSDLIHIWPTIYYNLHLEQSLKTLTLSGINW